MHAITTAIETFKPALADRIANLIHRDAHRMIAKHGDDVRSIYNSTDASYWRETLKYACDSHGGGRERITYTVNNDKIAKMAATLADATAESWRDKIIAKLGDVTEVSVNALGPASFDIHCRKGERCVVIRQEAIINCSSKGKLFHQFPARIMVDGKPTSEAKFKQL